MVFDFVEVSSFFVPLIINYNVNENSYELRGMLQRRLARVTFRERGRNRDKQRERGTKQRKTGKG